RHLRRHGLLPARVACLDRAFPDRRDALHADRRARARTARARRRAMKSARLRSSGAPQLAPEARALLDALPFPAALSTAGGTLLHENAAMRTSREPGPRDTLSVKLPGAGECTLVIRRPSDAQTQRLAVLGFMLAGVCHEISNPLAAIHSMLQILQSKRGVSRETLEKGLASIASNIDRVLAISRKLGDFSRVGAEPPSAVALDAAMEAAAALLHHSEQARQVQLDYRGAGSATILARRGQLEQVLFNILLNAAQAMQGKGRIEARARKAPRVLVVDDDPGLAGVIELLLSREGYLAERAGSVKAALEHISATEPDLVITDLKLPDGTGLDVIERVRAERPELPLIMITSYSSLESAIGALRAGAVDYLVKPFLNDEFLHAVDRALNERRMKRENAMLKRGLSAAYGTWPLIGESAAMRRVVELVRKAAPADAHVLISGETGTGRERVAFALHNASPRADGPFVPVDCAALQREGLEDELFGTPRREGLLQQADGGTLFLEDVAELASALQAKLLHALEEKVVRRSHAIDVRFIAATHRDLAAAAERGEFRKDLYYRLSVISIVLPPLRERTGDALLLARHFAEHYARRLGKRVSGFDAEFAAFLEKHPWPG